MQMSVVNSWRDLAHEAALKFPETDPDAIFAREGDMAGLAQLIASAHDLTFAEAAEMVTFRLPMFVEPERLSA